MSAKQRRRDRYEDDYDDEPTPRKGGGAGVVLAVLAGGTALVCLACLGLFGWYASTRERPNLEPLEVSLREVQDDYRTNPVAAKEKYADRVLVIDAYVCGVRQAIMGFTVELSYQKESFVLGTTRTEFITQRSGVIEQIKPLKPKDRVRAHVKFDDQFCGTLYGIEIIP